MTDNCLKWYNVLLTVFIALATSRERLLLIPDGNGNTVVLYVIWAVTGDNLENIKILDKFAVCKIFLTGETVNDVFPTRFVCISLYEFISRDKPFILTVCVSPSKGKVIESSACPFSASVISL